MLEGLFGGGRLAPWGCAAGLSWWVCLAVRAGWDKPGVLPSVGAVLLRRGARWQAARWVVVVRLSPARLWAWPVTFSWSSRTPATWVRHRSPARRLVMAAANAANRADLGPAATGCSCVPARRNLGFFGGTALRQSLAAHGMHGGGSREGRDTEPVDSAAGHWAAAEGSTQCPPTTSSGSPARTPQLSRAARQDRFTEKNHKLVINTWTAGAILRRGVVSVGHIRRSCSKVSCILW
jgi:hypothetical protein